MMFFVNENYSAWAVVDPQRIEAIAFNENIEVKWDAAIPTAAVPTDIAGYYLTREAGGSGVFEEWPPNPNLISYWKFDGINTGARDFGKNVNSTPSTTLTPNDFTDAVIVNGINFGGSKYIIAGTDSDYNFNAGSSFTISFWIQHDGGLSSAEVILAKTTDILGEEGYAITYNNLNRKIGFGLIDTTKHYVLTAPNTVRNEPTHIAITYSGNSNLNGVKIYVDGSLHVQGPNESIGTITNSENLVIGAESDGHRPATVILDDLRIYSEALSEAEIQEIMTLSVDPLIISITDDNVLPGVSYCYKVFSVGNDGQSLAGTLTPACPVPGGNLPASLSSPPSWTMDPVSGLMVISWNIPQPQPSSYYITRMVNGQDSYFEERPFSLQPVSYWKFDGDGNNLFDFGINQNYLDDNGFVFTNDVGKTAGAVNFNGATYLTTGNEYPYDFYGPVAQDRDFSIAFWIKPTTGTSSASTVLAKTTNILLGGKGFAVTYNDLNQKIGFEFLDGSSQYLVLTGKDAVPHGVWTHVAITYSGNQNRDGVRIFINAGTNPLQGTSAGFSQLLTLNNDNLAIGAESDGGRPFTGLIDDLRIYDKELSFNEIQTLYNGGNSFTVSSSGWQDPETVPNSQASSYQYRIYPVNDFGQSVSSPSAGPTSIVFRNAPFEVEHGGIITLTHPNANTNDFVKEKVIVQVSREASGSPPLSIVLMETGRDSGEFDNHRALLIFSLSESDASVPVLHVSPSGTPAVDTVKAVYQTLTPATATVRQSGGSFTPSGTLAPTQKIDCVSPPPPGPTDNDIICPEWENTGEIRIPVQVSSGTHYYTIPSSVDPITPDPSVEDVYVEIDYMVGHRPDPAVISALEAVFKNQGINLHLFVDEELPFHYDRMNWSFDVTDPDIVGYHQIKKSYFGTPQERSGTQEIIDANILAKRQFFHYSIFGHKFYGDLTTSGISEVGGNDFMVTLGALLDSTGSPDHQVGTLMHEFGHNLNLKDGGGDDVGCKPNYFSVMSYSRQFSELIPERPLDYSRWGIGEVPNIVEISIDEDLGIGSAETGSRGLRTVIGYYDDLVSPPLELTPFVHMTNIPADVDRGGVLGTANINVHRIFDIGCIQTLKTTLYSHDDWGNLDYNFADSSYFSTGASVSDSDPTTHERMDGDNVKGIRLLHLKMLRDSVTDLPFGGN